MNANGPSAGMNDRYTYRVTWSEDDNEWVGFCAEFPSLTWLALRNVSIKMRHPGQIFRVPYSQSNIGLFIHAALGKRGGLGILPLNRFGCLSYALANTVERAL